VVVSIFFGFHCWLIAKNMTTIEFCEKSGGKTEYKSIYSDGLYNNVCAALGDNPILWALPLGLPSAGGGLTFSGGTVKDKYETVPVADGGVSKKGGGKATPRGADGGPGDEKQPLLAGGVP